jgi:glycosyltransferase involved in cell wall biosynthesis
MKALHCAATLEPASGGPARAVPQLAAAVNKLGHEVALWTPAPRGEGSGDGLQEFGTQRFTGSFSDALTAFGQPDLVHDQGLWLPCHHQVVAACARRGIPCVVSPIGMLAPWALRYKRWKKRIAWWIYQRRDLRSVRCLHATSQQEVDSLRAVGLRNCIALIPNGVELPNGGCRKPEARDQRTALFLGRIHPVKGLRNLVEAWHIARPDGWRCIVAGPDEAGHQKELQALLRLHNLESSFEFPGMIADGGKWAKFRQADLFVLPSFTENFGIVVAEALAAGLPVITTKGTPWEELRTRQCGWWVEIGVEPLAAALREATSLSDQERYEMGQHSRCLVEEKYSWPRIGREMLAVYQWILGNGPQPDSVIQKSAIRAK